MAFPTTPPSLISILCLLSLVCYAGFFETELSHPTLVFGGKGDAGQAKPLSHYFWPQLPLILWSFALSKQFFYQNRSTYKDRNRDIHREFCEWRNMPKRAHLASFLYTNLCFCLHLPHLFKIYYAVSMSKISATNRHFSFCCFFYG